MSRPSTPIAWLVEANGYSSHCLPGPAPGRFGQYQVICVRFFELRRGPSGARPFLARLVRGGLGITS
ncbi:hypothetical protein SAMN05660976_02459 [Nonomuraea pusilla]|uniref:Uncharacterized protein n=1 Tax=Nonomuraea pusilla TaxID=46177 RepID=A0A1H7Q8W7_9ACTN|nr:hypothetical protein SAMN05660976_02459 [Nonomuraea pusilla]